MSSLPPIAWYLMLWIFVYVLARWVLGPLGRRFLLGECPGLTSAEVGFAHDALVLEDSTTRGWVATGSNKLTRAEKRRVAAGLTTIVEYERARRDYEWGQWFYNDCLARIVLIVGAACLIVSVVIYAIQFFA